MGVRYFVFNSRCCVRSRDCVTVVSVLLLLIDDKICVKLYISSGVRSLGMQVAKRRKFPLHYRVKSMLA